MGVREMEHTKTGGVLSHLLIELISINPLNFEQ